MKLDNRPLHLFHASRRQRRASVTHYASRLAKSPNSKWIVSLFLFLLALLPRLPDLGRFLTADEFLWVGRSRDFLAGLTNPAYECTTVVEKWQSAHGLACTLRTGHPGVTTMWTGSFGFVLRWLADGRPAALHDYVTGVSTNPLDAAFIAPERLGTVLITSLWVVALYWLVRRLFGARIALVGAVLIALDPFHIALSRVIHHDALSTTFMTLSALSAFIYWGQQAGRKWLVLSGMLAGFGFLSKSPALYLMPFIALAGLWFMVKGVRNRQDDVRKSPTSYSLLPTPYFAPLLQTILDGFLWLVAAVAVVFVFWPAMWVAPLEALHTVFFIGSKYATGGHAKGNFFLGQVSKDPGPLFYPVTWLYRTSPLAVIGVAGALIAWPGKSRGRGGAEGQEDKGDSFSRPPTRLFFRYMPLILAFILGYYLFMTLGEKKQDRYFLPAYPWLNLIAAAGLISIYDGVPFGYLRFTIYDFYISRITHLYPERSRRDASRTPALNKAEGTHHAIYLLPIILLVNGYLVASNYPYYFTYYDPVLGGIKSAVRATTIGWGEGLDLAADYLNKKTDPAHTRVASWYESTFAPFYHGQSISYSKEKGKVLAGDYAVFYINQVQRRFPDDVLFDYFETRFEPETIIALHGVDYVWIYPSLGVDHYIQDQTYTGIASLLAWQWTEGDKPLIPGQPGDFELYWEYLGKKPDEHFFFRLVDRQGRLWAEGESRPVASENPPLERWREGEIIYERGTLTVPVDTPPGQYRLQIGFYTRAPAVTEGELLFTVPDDEALVTVGRPKPTSFTLPDTATPIEQPLGDSLTLLGASWPNDPLPAETFFPVDLYWRVEQPLPADFNLHVGLVDTAGQPQQAWFNLNLAETFNRSKTTWQPGDVFRTRWQFNLLPEVPPGRYHFDLVLPDDIMKVLSFGELVVGH